MQVGGSQADMEQAIYAELVNAGFQARKKYGYGPDVIIVITEDKSDNPLYRVRRVSPVRAVLLTPSDRRSSAPATCVFPSCGESRRTTDSNADARATDVHDAMRHLKERRPAQRPVSEQPGHQAVRLFLSWTRRPLTRVCSNVKLGGICHRVDTPLTKGVPTMVVGAFSTLLFDSTC